MLGFIKAYIKSMRLYYAFITGIAGWLGVVYYEYTTGVGLGLMRKTVILILLFLSWGINQIINDYLGLKEDKINAPQRPMVTGELESSKAVMTSCVLLLICLGVIWVYLEPLAIIPALAGVFLNVIYEYAKGFGVVGNIVFGLMISMSAAVGFFAAGPVRYPYITKELLAVFILVAVMNAVMTFYTYFKDYKGDKASGKRTIVVRYGVRKARVIALLSAFIPLIAFSVVYQLGFTDIEINRVFIFLWTMTVILLFWTGFLYYKYPEGERTYYSLAANFRACSCGQAALIALFDTQLAMMLFILAYVFVGLLFDLHSNSKG